MLVVFVFLIGDGACQCAAIICALLAFWASRKGYQYYKAKSDLGSTQAQNNPYFKSDGLSGSVPQN